MAQTCKTCKRKDVAEINKLITSGKPLRYIVDNYGIPNGSIQRHKENCLPGLFAEVIEQKRAGLLADVDEAKQRIRQLEAEFADNGTVQVQLVARRLDAIDKEAKLTGAYTKEKENPTQVAEIANEVVKNLIAQGWKESDATAFAAQKYPEAIQQGQIG